MIIVPHVPINEAFSDVNITYEISSPEEGQTMFFDIDLGYIIEDALLPGQHQFYVNTTSEEKGSNLYRAKINMMHMGMKFVRTQANYVRDTFLQNGCFNATLMNDKEYPVLNCNSGSNSVPGLPVFQLNLGHNQKFDFNSSEYFIFPTQSEFSTPVNAYFGLGYLGDETHSVSNDTFELGQLFVKKY